MKNRRFAMLSGSALAAGLLLLPGTSTAGEAQSAGAFERFKALTGDWLAAEDGDMTKKGDLVARYHQTGSGSAVVEELFPGTPHQMTTVYHMDGSDLVLTHYCMSGNQPRMRARPSTRSRVSFAFDGGTNLDPKRDEHMHAASFEFVSADELRSEWIEHAGGKPKMTVRMHLVRKTS